MQEKQSIHFFSSYKRTREKNVTLPLLILRDKYSENDRAKSLKFLGVLLYENLNHMNEHMKNI